MNNCWGLHISGINIYSAQSEEIQKKTNWLENKCVNIVYNMIYSLIVSVEYTLLAISRHLEAVPIWRPLWRGASMLG